MKYARSREKSAYIDCRHELLALLLVVDVWSKEFQYLLLAGLVD